MSKETTPAGCERGFTRRAIKHAIAEFDENMVHGFTYTPDIYRENSREIRLSLADEGLEKPGDALLWIFAAEEAFLLAINDPKIGYPKKFSSPTDRIKFSDLITLHYLLVGGKLDELGTIIPGEERQKRGEAFIEGVRRKNKETQIARRKHPITMGIEVEYDDTALARLRDYELYREELSKHFKLRSGQKISDIGQDQHTSKEIKRELAYFKKLARSFFGDFLPARDAFADVELSLLLCPNVIWNLIHESQKPLDSYWEGTGYETITHPGASYKTMLREILYTHLTGGIGNESEWNIHVTTGGIDLDKQHTEIMDVLLISSAAGFAGRNIYGEATSINEEIIREHDPKGSFVENGRLHSGTRIYFPFHRRRSNYELEAYQAKTLTGVEQRSALKYTIDEFPLFVRHVHFTNRAAYAIQARQHPVPERNNEALTGTWLELMKNWHALLIEYGLPILRPREYWMPIDKVSRPNMYMKALSRIIDLSKTDETFRNRARTTIREFTATVGSVL